MTLGNLPYASSLSLEFSSLFALPSYTQVRLTPPSASIPRVQLGSHNDASRTLLSGLPFLKSPRRWTQTSWQDLAHHLMSSTRAKDTEAGKQNSTTLGISTLSLQDVISMEYGWPLLSTNAVSFPLTRSFLTLRTNKSRLSPQEPQLYNLLED